MLVEACTAATAKQAAAKSIISKNMDSHAQAGRRLPLVATSNTCQRQLVGLRSAFSKKQYNEKEAYSAGKFAVIAG